MDDSAVAALESLVPTQATQRLPELNTVNAQLPGAEDNFTQMVSEGISQVNQELLVSQTDLQQLATGNAQNLHQIMMRLEESRLSFELLMQVRNRAMEAYQDVMKMQV